jgi:hypothetical protein
MMMGEQGARCATRSLTPLSAPNADESPPPDKKEVGVACR